MFHHIRISFRTVQSIWLRALTRTLHFSLTLTDCIADVHQRQMWRWKTIFRSRARAYPSFWCMRFVHLEFWWSIPNVPTAPFDAHTKYARSENAQILRKPNSNLSIPMTRWCSVTARYGEANRREERCMEVEQENVQHFNFIASVSTLLNFIKIHECQCIYMGASRSKLFIRFQMFDTPNQHIWRMPLTHTQAMCP